MESNFHENEFLWNQLIKLGDMMGDGLHHEPNGKWISKEYRKIAKILMPPSAEEKKIKKENIDFQMKTILEKSSCKCGGKLIQKRSGTKVAYCEVCNAKYVAKKKK